MAMRGMLLLLMPSFSDFLNQVRRGRTIYRILANWTIAKEVVVRRTPIFDMAGTHRASYYHYLSLPEQTVAANYQLSSGVDRVIDLNKPIALEDRSVGTLLFFNAVYIIKDRQMMWREFFRLLDDDGDLYILSPFIANEMSEPDDFARLTEQGLISELREAGFGRVRVVRFGERVTSAVYLLNPFLVWWPLRMLAYLLSLGLDRLIPRSVRERHPTPLGYLCIVKK